MIFPSLSISWTNWQYIIKVESKIYHMTWPVQKESLCKEICSSCRKLLPRKSPALLPFPRQVFLPYIHEQQALHSTINEAITKPFLSLQAFVNEKLIFEDKEI